MDGDIRWVLPLGKQWPPGGFHLLSRVSQPKPVTGSGCISKYYVYIYIYIDRCLRFDGFYLSHTYRWCFSNIPYFQPDALRKMIQVDFKERSDGLVQPPTIRFTIRFTNRFIPTSMALWNPDPGAWFFSFLPGLSAAWDTQQPHEHWKHLDGYQLPSICSWGSRKNSQ